MTELITPYDVLNDSDATTRYVDTIIQKVLEHEGVFDQFTPRVSLGSNDDNAPASFNYEYIKKTGKNFEITETRPGTLAEEHADAYEISTGTIRLFSGKILTPYELQKVQRWGIAEDILNDMAVSAAEDYEKSLAEYFTDTITDVAEATGGTFAFPDDLLTLRRATYNSAKRMPDVLMISTDLIDVLLKDDNFIMVDQYGGREALFNGEIGRLFGLRIVETPWLSNDAITTGKPVDHCMICFRNSLGPFRVEFWEPLFRFYSWYDEDIHTYVNELRAFYERRIYDATAVRQMIFTA